MVYILIFLDFDPYISKSRPHSLSICTVCRFNNVDDKDYKDFEYEVKNPNRK